MFKLSEIKELIKVVNQSKIQELEIENEGSRICIRKQNTNEYVTTNHVQPNYNPSNYQQVAPSPQADNGAKDTVAPSATEDSKAANLHTIASPMVGTFYASPTPSAPAFTKKGDKVSEHTVVCIIEAMKLMNEIEAEVKGEITEILVENGQLVEFGQPLFLVKTQ